MSERARVWLNNLPLLVRSVLIAQVLAHVAVVASGRDTCLDLEAVLIRGEWHRLLAFLAVSPTGLFRGVPALVAQGAAWVAVGRAIEHRVGSAGLLVRTGVLSVLSIASVALFVALGVLIALSAMLLPVPTGVLAGAAERLPPVHVCPSGFSGIVAALALVELAHKWVSVGRHVLPGFFVVIVGGVLLFPLGGFSVLLLHELGWIAGFVFVLLLAPRLPARFPRVAAWLSAFPHCVPEPPETPPELIVDEVSAGELGVFVYQSLFAHQKTPFLEEPREQSAV
jgi:hypothetical protein